MLEDDQHLGGMHGVSAPSVRQALRNVTAYLKEVSGQ